MLTVEIAQTQLGVTEATGNNDGIPAERYNYGEKLPWCSAFILWCNFHSDDVKLATTKAERFDFRSVQILEDALKKRGWWLSPQGRLPQKNDLIFFADRGASDAAGKAPGRHIGIVEALNAGHLVSSIEGNWGNRVARVSHDLLVPKDAGRITGYARFPLSA